MTDKKQTGLTYTGGGTGVFLFGVPARDLTPEEVENYGGEETLLATGLYAKPTPAQKEVKG